MPHVVVKLWPGKSEQQKKRRARASDCRRAGCGWGKERVWNLMFRTYAPWG